MNVTSTLWRTSVSSYLRTFLRLVFGLATFRMLYQGLPKADFGFWSLLWSVFGYGVLVDFGLGFAAQKRVAELTVTKAWDDLSRILSTIITFFFGVGVVIFFAGWLGAGTILGWLQLPGGEVTEYHDVFVIFCIGLALGFPLGVFPEILRGLQRVSTVNHVVSIFLVANFALVAAALHFGWGLKTILMIALATTIGPDLVCAFIAMRALPHVRIRLGLFDRSKVRDTMQFSIFAYLITATNIVLGKTDQLAQHGYRTLAAADGAEALSLFAQQRNDIAAVFTDVMMPLVDGVALCRALKRIDPEVRIIAATGIAEEGRLQELRSLKIEPILNKPFSTGTLLGALNEVLTS